MGWLTKSVVMLVTEKDDRGWLCVGAGGGRELLLSTNVV